MSQRVTDSLRQGLGDRTVTQSGQGSLRRGLGNRTVTQSGQGSLRRGLSIRTTASRSARRVLGTRIER